MNELKNLLQEKLEYYKEIYKKAENSLKNSPTEGHLRVAKCHGSYQYYLVTQKGDTHGTYMQKKMQKEAKRFAQRDYDKKVCKLCEQAESAIEEFLQKYPTEVISNIDRFSPGRYKLIKPYELTDDEYVEKWESEVYKGKDFEEKPEDGSKELFTEKGERVRSKSEMIIANKLYQMGIPYRYEYPTRIRGLGTIYPDFRLLHVKERREIILEHFGMMDNPDYSTQACNKINLYIMNGYQVGKDIVFTYETSNYPLNTKVLEQLLQQIFVSIKGEDS